jgi:hypothetical protein
VNPDFDDLVGTEATGAERERLRRTHDLLLQAGPPPELPPQLQTAPNVGARVTRLRRREVKRRAVLLLAAALSIAVVFAAGYAVASSRGGKSATALAARLVLKGTSAAPRAQGTLDVWRPQGGNWPMTLSVSGLPKHARYEVYLVRNGRPWGSCGGFRVGSSSGSMTLRLTAPYALRKGDSWVVTRLVHGSEPGRTVLSPALKA